MKSFLVFVNLDNVTIFWIVFGIVIGVALLTTIFILLNKFVFRRHKAKNTLKEVVELRNSAYDKMSDDEKIKTNEKLSSGISEIMALAEAYPDLKANENFKDLSNQLRKVEDEIANSRKYYNGVVRIYNNKVEMFPSNVFAGLFGYKSKAMFEVSSNERENVKVEL